MNDNVSKYLHKHTFFISVVVVLTFLLVFAGEFYLYRNQMKLNQMISEGFMQIKEMQNSQATAPTPIAHAPKK